MIQLSAHTRVFLFVEPVDFRKGIDGLAGLCRSRLHQDPMSGTVFVFINRRRTCLKVLAYDGQGFWLCQKRLSQGRVRYWPRNEEPVSPWQVQVLLCNGDPWGTKIASAWKPLAA